MKRERWPGERYDAEDRPWALRNAPWLVWSRTRVRVPGKGGKTGISTGELAALVLIYALFLSASIAAAIAEFVQHQPIWPAAMNIVLWGGLGSVLGWRLYCPARRYTLFHDRTCARRCPSCAQPLVHDDRAGGDTTRRCPECGHLWRWPPANVNVPYLGW